MKAGELVMLATGEYSDYHIHTLCKVAVDFDPDALLLVYLELYPEQADRFKFEETKFIEWLVVNMRKLIELDYSEWHFANYGSIQDGYGVSRETKLFAPAAQEQLWHFVSGFAPTTTFTGLLAGRL